MTTVRGIANVGKVTALRNAFNVQCGTPKKGGKSKRNGGGQNMTIGESPGSGWVMEIFSMEPNGSKPFMIVPGWLEDAIGAAKAKPPQDRDLVEVIMATCTVVDVELHDLDVDEDPLYPGNNSTGDVEPKPKGK